MSPVGPHRLRHSAATAMLRAGASLDEVGQVLRRARRGSHGSLREGRLRGVAPAGGAVAR